MIWWIGRPLSNQSEFQLYVQLLFSIFIEAAMAVFTQNNMSLYPNKFITSSKQFILIHIFWNIDDRAFRKCLQNLLGSDKSQSHYHLMHDVCSTLTS